MTAGQALGGERRQLTIMFCDLVGSTSLSQRLDPEDLRDVIHVFQDCCSAVVARYGGHVAAFHGDALLVFFGYPRSHEDAAERAVRAALEVVEAIESLEPPGGFKLQTHIGIATGLVVIGEGKGGEPEVVGETPNLAARLQGLAQTNGIIVSASTRRLTGRLFDFVDLGSHALKGFADPVPAWAVRAINPVEGRFDALRSPELTDLVGRRAELALLREHWQSAREGTGNVVLIRGEAGIGKSRLLKEFADSTAAHMTFVGRFYGSPYHTNSALHPVIEAGNRFVGHAERPTMRRLATLEDALKSLGGAWAEYLPWLATLLEIPTDRFARPISPHQRKERTLAAVLWLLKSVADQRQTLLLVEDAHWLDPSSLELLDCVIDQVPLRRILLVITFRPELRSRWLDRPHVVLLPLERLSRDETATMVAKVAGSRTMPAALIETIVARTDGVPLFVEELTEAVLGSGDASELSGAALPTTLQDSLLARLDQLSSPKRIAQIAAVIGREFRYELLAEIAALTDSALNRALAELMEAGLILGRGEPPAARYAFKHSLVQEAAYAGLLKRDRRELHGRVASVLEREVASISHGQPEVLAHHYTEAGLAPQALENWARATQRAFERSANLEVIAHARRGLDLLATLPESPERVRTELSFQLFLGGAYRATKGFASIEVEQIFDRVSELATTLCDRDRLMDISRGLCACYYARGQLTAAWAQAERAMTLAQESGMHGDLTVAHLLRGQILFWRGEFAPARDELEAALALYEPAEQRSKILSLQIDPSVNARMHLGWSLWILGYPEQALAAVERATEDARQTAQPFGLAMALFWNGCVQFCCGRLRATEAIVNELHAVTSEQHIAYLGACASVLEAAILIVSGDVERGVAHIRMALAAFRAQQAGLGWPWALSLAVEGLVKGGRPVDGLAVLEECFAALARDGERQWEAELHRLEGELLAGEPKTSAEAERAFHEAITTARRQGARSLELRASLGLGRLLTKRGRCAEAVALVGGLYREFDEGFDTNDLRMARDFLQEREAQRNGLGADHD